MSLVDEQDMFFEDVTLLYKFCKGLGWKVTMGEVYRTQEQQEIYFKTGRSKTMNSNHLRRLAIDLNFFDKEGKLISSLETLEPVGKYWEMLHTKNRWGGHFTSFKDAPHFERNV